MAAVQSCLLVIPQNETYGPLRAYAGTAQYARQLHHQRRARSVIVRGLAPSDAVHVPADDVHLFGMRTVDFCAVNLLPRTTHTRLRVECAQFGIRLGIWIGIYARAGANASQ